MKNNVKKGIISALALSAVALCAGAFSVNVTAQADTAAMPDLFIDGASVYLGGTEGDVDTNGIRFCIVAKADLVSSGKSVGALVLPADMAPDAELNKGDNENAVDEVFETEDWVDSVEYAGYKQTYVYVYNYPVNDYNRELYCNAYVDDGATVTYAGTVSRSMAYVARALEDLGDNSARAYIKRYHVNYYTDATETAEVSGLENENVRYGDVIEEPETPADTETQTFVGWYADKDYTTEFDFTKVAKGTTKVYAKWAAKYVPPFATTVFANGGTFTNKATFAYGDTDSTSTDWYYNKTTGTLTKSFLNPNGGSDFDDRLYLRQAQTGDFTFTTTATLGRNVGFEFTYNTGAAFKRFFIGNFYGGLRVCIGDSVTSAMYVGLGIDEETTFKFVKNSSNMKVYISNATTQNVETLALTISSTGIVRSLGTDNNVTNQATVASAFSAMFAKDVVIGFTAVGSHTNAAVYKNISVVPEAIAPITFASTVSLNGGSFTNNAVLTYGTTDSTSTDWYYNQTTGTLTKTFDNPRGGTDFDDRIYLAEAQTGDFTFTTTATLAVDTGFEFTYNDGTKIHRFFIGNFWGGLRVCIGDSGTPTMYQGMGTNEETTYKFVKTSTKMEVYLTNSVTENVEKLALTITADGITKNFGTDNNVANQAATASAFAAMFTKDVAIGFTAIGARTNTAVYKNIKIA